MERRDRVCPSPALLFHQRHRYRNAVECRRQIDLQNRIPFGSRELIDRGGKLDAGVVHQNVFSLGKAEVAWKRRRFRV